MKPLFLALLVLISLILCTGLVVVQHWSALTAPVPLPPPLTEDPLKPP